MRLLQFPGFNKFVFPAALYALILAGSSIPGPEIPKVFQLTPDKLIHFAEYFVLGFFMARGLIIFSWSKGRVFWVCCAAGLGAAGLDELYQHLIPGRTPDVRDWLVDAAGVVAGVLTLLAVWKKSIEVKGR
jgi:VanZ family protein